MCAVAVKSYKTGERLPEVEAPPSTASPLYWRLFRQQTRTMFGPLGVIILRFILWTVFSRSVLRRRSIEEFVTIQERLEAGDIVQLGVVYPKARQKLAPWYNHQVALLDASLRVYDPNRPCCDDITLQERDDRWYLVDGDDPYQEVVGFFAVSR